MNEAGDDPSEGVAEAVLRGVGQLSLPPERRRPLIAALRAVADDLPGACTVLVAGSLLTAARYLDMDLMVIKPDAPDFQRAVRLERIDGLKAEVFIESTGTVLRRLHAEQRLNLHGLAELLLHGRDLMGDSAELAALREMALELLEAPPAPASRAYLAFQLQNAVDALGRCVAAGDRLALTVDLLNLVRQSFHLLQGRRSEGCLKHFFRRLAREQWALHTSLQDAIVASLNGDAAPLSRWVHDWMRAESLQAPQRLRIEASGVYA